jgi:hypothetical protein
MIWRALQSSYYRDLTILGRQRDDDGQNKLLQINGSKDNSWYIINRMNLIQSGLEVEDMGFMFGKIEFC